MAQSSDPDADAVMASYDHPEAAHDSDAAAVLASYDKPKETTPKKSDPVGDLVRHEATSAIMYPVALARHAYDVTLGGRTAADADARQQQFMADHTTPLTDPKAQELGGIYNQVQSSNLNPLSYPGKAMNAAGDAVGNVSGSPELGAATKDALQVAGILAPGSMKGERTLTTAGAQAKLDTAAANSPQSMGAAAAAPKLEQLSPELRQAVTQAVQKTGGAVNPEALTRHVQADSLPVKMTLTEGQATQDPVAISNEMNRRGKDENTARFFTKQNDNLKANISALRDRVGPDVFSSNDVEHGDTLIKAYEDKGAAADADIDAKYQALRDRNGGQFPVDAQKLYQNASGELHDKLLFEHAPKELDQLKTLADKGSMTFEQFEAMRTNLARTMRSSSNGNEIAAASTIRNEMEKLPLQGTAQQLKPLADQARSAAKAQFDAVKADPAYEAALSGKVPPDQYVRKFVTGPSATRDGVETMKQNLAHDDTATQTMGVAALDHLRKSAGIDPMGNGNFTQAGFNKALIALDPKLKSLVDPKTAEDLSNVGDVARYTQNQPRGSYVNNSNSWVAAAGHLAGNATEHVLSHYVPVVGKLAATGVSAAREAMGKRAAADEAAKSLKPGAGLERLSDFK